MKPVIVSPIYREGRTYQNIRHNVPQEIIYKIEDDIGREVYAAIGADVIKKNMRIINKSRERNNE